MIHKKSSTNNITVNNLGNSGESLAGYFNATSIVVASMRGTIWSTKETIGGFHMGATTFDASNGKGGGVGGCMDAFPMDGSDGKGGGLCTSVATVN